MDLKNSIFLLGGHDLEMEEISNILLEGKFHFYDRCLSWGARLSSYHDLLNDVEHFVGIELIEDIPLPKNYTRIDHHNENYQNPSSIEQLAKILNIDLNRRQRLIAANDSGYIPAMIALEASLEEIASIRKFDCAAQGITADDEKLAVISIKQNLRVEKDLIIVKSLTGKFSTITDRLFPFIKLLIFTDHELTYYGINAALLSLEYHELIKARKAFSGGGENGFFGIAHDGLPPKELLHLKNEIISRIARKTKDI